MNFTTLWLAMQCIVLALFVGFVATHEVEIVTWLRGCGL